MKVDMPLNKETKPNVIPFNFVFSLHLYFTLSTATRQINVRNELKHKVFLCFTINQIAQSAKAVEYTDCISAKE